MVSVRCFGVRVSVMFNFMFAHYTFSSVWVAEWPPFGKYLPARLAICSHCILSTKINAMFYLQFWGLKLLISKIVLIQWFCLPIKTLIA